MDYSRLGVSDKRKELKSVSRRMGSKFLITGFRIFILAIVAVSVIGVVAAFGAFRGILDTTPDVELAVLEVSGFSSKSLYADGTLAQNFAGNAANRIYVEIDRIPQHVRNAFLAAEDWRFYQHSGIDIRTIFRSGYSIVTSDGFEAGGSTITQQLIKNQIFGGGREKYTLDKVLRKIREQYIAINLEHVLSKDEILEYYMNMVNLGNNSYGVETAAQNYFGKSTEELTISEAAVIGGIPLSPTRLNPLRNPDENLERRNNILGNMLKYEFITQEEYDEAMADSVAVYERIVEQSTKDTRPHVGVYSYFTDAMMDQLYKDFQERLGYTRAEAEHMLFYGGLTIYTTQEPEIQSIVDRYYQDENNFPKFGFDSSHGSCYELSDYRLSVTYANGEVVHYQRSDFLKYFAEYEDRKGLYYHANGIKKGINELFLDKDDLEEKIAQFRAAKVDEEAGDTYIETKEITPQPQSSMTIIEQSTGKVIAICGGRGEKTVSRSLNRASKSTRSVGSTFKVLASFLPALDAGGLTLASVQDDSPFFYPNGRKEVINWYKTGFRGLQPLRKGISNSLNVVAVKTLDQIGAPLGYEYLKKLGFTTLVDYEVDENGRAYSDVNLAIALGGLTKGVTNVELTAAYASIANGGLYNKPIYYTKVVDHEGNVILSNKTDPSQIMKASTAWLLTDAMHDVTTTGTGTRLAFRNYKMPVAGKTGTASKNSDLWFVGYTPYYTCAVWTGFDQPFSQWNKSYQQDLWRNIMEDIHSYKQLEYKEWEKPDSIVEATICTKCGNLAVYGLCDNAAGGPCVKTEYFAKGTVPTKKCTCHTRVQICSESGMVATENCPEGDKRWAVLLVKDENYHKYDGYPGYTNGCWVSTADTPYVYHPGNTCDVHHPGDADREDDDGEGSHNGGDLFEKVEDYGPEDDVYDE